ncbi:peptidase [Alphaproteobacteria bacterium]|nr:peptidase [Alphaproteobacteria bacterium]
MSAENQKMSGARERLKQAALSSSEDVIRMACALIRCNSETPPGDTRAVCQKAMALISDIPGVKVRTHCLQNPVVNMIACLSGGAPGRRIVFSGHLDTYPAGALERWSEDPFGGIVKDGFLYGRGSCDMKGGIAASIMAMRLIALTGTPFPGEIVLALAGDEESMGELGTQAMIDSLPECRADAVIVADVGSPDVVRCGEKGMIWLRLDACGKAAHGAHAHRGVNAVDRLLEALRAIAGLETIRISPDHPCVRVMQKAKPVSEPLGGAGEMETMSRVTVNVGLIGGGTSPNLVPDSAWAELDIRIPAGVSVAELEARLVGMMGSFPNVRLSVLRRYEASWTDPDDRVVEKARSVASEILRRPVAVNMRVGASDARLWRRAGTPTVVCGLTPYNLGAGDEKLDVRELPQLTAILALTAFDFLCAPP